MAATLGELLQKNSYLVLQPNNKILCKVSGHEMPARADVVQSHIIGKKFKKILEWYQYDYSVFLPDIVEHKTNSKQLFCTITNQELNKVPEEIKNHIAGKRFKRYNIHKLG